VGAMSSPVDTTYLADNVVLFRFFEASGSVRRAVSVAKKRTGSHEKFIREIDMDEHGIVIGAPLVDFHGVLTGVPTYTGKSDPLMKAAPNAG
ncbi:MAG TPA: circadian clock protein KaiC, partial [Burkholderiales bacterium]|nr:circadian clock protein KaiC [Burkholderiales bacterium]